MKTPGIPAGPVFELAVRSQPAFASSYALSPEMARICFPAAADDPQRKLARANSICVLFLTIGAVGFHPTPVQTRPLKPLEEPLRMEWEQTQATDEPAGSTESGSSGETVPLDLTPLVPPPLVAPIGIQGSPSLVTTTDITPMVLPPANPPQTPLPKPAPPEKWDDVSPSSGSDGGFRPSPDYPWRLKQQRIQGTVVLRMVVAENGVPQEVRIHTGSGSSELDEHTREWVIKHWRWQPGPIRYCSWKCSYILQ